MLAYPGRAGDIGVCLAKQGKNERLLIVEVDQDGFPRSRE
jgi:hypothetical protein